MQRQDMQDSSQRRGNAHARDKSGFAQSDSQRQMKAHAVLPEFPTRPVASF